MTLLVFSVLVLYLSGAISAFAPSKYSAFPAVPSSSVGRHSGRVFSSLNSDPDRHEDKKSRFLPKEAFKIYTEYARRLWNETNTEARKNIASDKVSGAIRQIHDITRASEQAGSLNVSDAALDELEEACTAMMETLRRNRTSMVEENEEEEESSELIMPGEKPIKLKKKPRRSIAFGAAMGLAVTGWVFSGNYLFGLFFTLMTILGQLEYYRMVINTGVYPARRISVIGACSMFLTALFTPELHQICLPTFGIWSMVWFLTMRRTVSTIPEIATTFTGMFYLGYVPSFWVRIRLLGGNREPTRIAPLMKPILNFFERKAESLPSFIPQAVHLPITSGAIFIFWSWLCLAFSDVGAYFVGKNFGKTKLGKISPAAGATSPNKTVEGVVGGCLVSGLLGVLGAWVQRWPFFIWTGAIHGVMLGLLGLLGDLTASMLKRDAGLKDFGDLIPEHGGVMDRVDSFVWTAPYSWVVCAYILPALKQFAR